MSSSSSGSSPCQSGLQAPCARASRAKRRVRGCRVVSVSHTNIKCVDTHQRLSDASCTGARTSQNRILSGRGDDPAALIRPCGTEPQHRGGLTGQADRKICLAHKSGNDRLVFHVPGAPPSRMVRCPDHQSAIRPALEHTALTGPPTGRGCCWLRVSIL